jgi:hypothetical protein
MDFGYLFSICWNRGKDGKTSSCTVQNLSDAGLFVARIAISKLSNKLARRNSRSIGENERHEDTEVPDAEDRNSITSLFLNFYCCTVHFDNFKILFTKKCTLY